MHSQQYGNEMKWEKKWSKSAANYPIHVVLGKPILLTGTWVPTYQIRGLEVATCLVLLWIKKMNAEQKMKVKS